MEIIKFLLLSDLLKRVFALNGCVANGLNTNASKAKFYSEETTSNHIDHYEQGRQKMVHRDSLHSFDASIHLTIIEEILSQKLVAYTRK